MVRITRVAQDDKSKVLLPVCDTISLTQGLPGHQLKTLTWKVDRDLLCIMMENRFLSASRIRVELTRGIRCRIFVCMVQGGLVVAVYHSKHPDRCPGLTPQHRHMRRILMHHCQNWNHQPWSHVIYADEFRVSVDHSDRPVSWMQQYTSL